MPRRSSVSIPHVCEVWRSVCFPSPVEVPGLFCCIVGFFGYILAVVRQLLLGGNMGFLTTGFSIIRVGGGLDGIYRHMVKVSTSSKVAIACLWDYRKCFENVNRNLVVGKCRQVGYLVPQS